MHAVNLYVLTRKVENDILPLYEKCISCREEELRIREGELNMINEIICNLRQAQAEPQCFDNWFYAFTIPQISKEFDLLKIGKNNTVVNIEIKEQEVEESKISRQLLQNRYYLSNICEEIFSFTCMQTNSGYIEIYMLNDNELEKVSFVELRNKIELIEEAIEFDVEKLFRPIDYLISPINTPERFLVDEYFLNNHQEEIKTKIVNGILGDKKIWGIKGGAGTGKTLLLYDIAKSLAKRFSVCIIHSGILSSGHNFLNSKLENVSIIDAKHACKEKIDQFDVICIDETQRLYKSTIDNILGSFNDGIFEGCIFSYDYAQCLSKTELNRNNPKRLKQIEGFQEEELSERIRTNKEIFSYIRTMLRLKDVPRKHIKYDCIEILYANNIQEADRLLDIYCDKGYIFITFTPSQFVMNEIDHYAGNVNSHQVIGQEFDNVVIILDKNFRYSESGDLEAREHPNPDYLFPKLFYQNITRAREKLCIIVLDNMKIFHTLLKIKDYSS